MSTSIRKYQLAFSQQENHSARESRGRRDPETWVRGWDRTWCRRRGRGNMRCRHRRTTRPIGRVCFRCKGQGESGPASTSEPPLTHLLPSSFLSDSDSDSDSDSLSGSSDRDWTVIRNTPHRNQTTDPTPYVISSFRFSIFNSTQNSTCSFVLAK